MFIKKLPNLLVMSGALFLSGCSAYVVDDGYYYSEPTPYYNYSPTHPSAIIINNRHHYGYKHRDNAFYGGIRIGGKHHR